MGRLPTRAPRYAVGSPEVSDGTVSPHPDASNPVLTKADVTDREDVVNLGDPFLCYEEGTYHLFFEVQTADDGSGVLDEDIGHATSSNGLEWEYEEVVIDDPGHLAYPHVFYWEDNWYLVPDSGAGPSIHFGGGVVRIYRATDFPTEWELVARPIWDEGLVDPTVFPYGGRWYLVAGKMGESGGYAGNYLYWADDLRGAWHEHPESPLFGDATAVKPERVARPGGRPIVASDHVDVFFQDCERVYGDKVRAYRITELTTESVTAEEYAYSPILESQFDGSWNDDGMHHVDQGLARSGVKNLVSVDGKSDNHLRSGSVGIYRLD